MPSPSLSLLGSFRAALDGQPIIGFESNKVRALLAYLAFEAGRLLAQRIDQAGPQVRP